MAPNTSYGNGVNLGGLYGPTAVAQSPRFVQQPERSALISRKEQLHVALVKIRNPQGLDDDTLGGIGTTLSQLGQLGLVSVVVLDCDDGLQANRDTANVHTWRILAVEQANRMVAAIDANDGPGARLVDNSLGVSMLEFKASSVIHMPKPVYIKYRKLLVNPLRQGIIPVVPSLGYEDLAERAVPLNSSEVVLALATELVGLREAFLPHEGPVALHNRLKALRDEVSLDRLIILDPLGGIPTLNRPNGYHVFLNMEQEYEGVQEELLNASKRLALEDIQGNQPEGIQVSDPGLSNPCSKFVGIENKSFARPNSSKSDIKGLQEPLTTKHLENIHLTRKVLSILPRSSSAIITTPEEASNSGHRQDALFYASGVGTRRHKNPLIHNLLTDKPIFSSSLPVGRLGQSACAQKKESKTITSKATTAPTTFIKHGISVTILPDPRRETWEPWQSGKQRITLTGSQFDLPRLVHLIENSFGRKLAVADYLQRVNGRIAGVIIAGEYEGGAILTWETPPGVVEDGSPESRARMVPYLDKFAVLTRAQGSSHADIVFKAMVRDCFPNGVVWRSRSDNVVNKWYFERSLGTWKLPGTNWTMFWTTPNMDKQTFLDYEGVCRRVVPSWADNKAVVD